MKAIIALITIACTGCAAPVARLPTSEDLTDWQRALREDTSQILAATTDTRDTLRANTEALQQIKKQLEASLVNPETANSEEVIQSTELSPADENANDSQPVTGFVAESAGVPLFVSVTTGCAPCERLKRDVDAGKFAGFDVRFVDQPDWQPRSYPAIRYKSDQSVTGYAVTYGYDESTLDWLRSHLLNERPALQTGVRSGPDTPMQHVDMVSLHNQLHGGGGQWTWPGDLATHLREVHGVAAADQSYSQVRRASNGVRLVSRRPVRNWGSGFVSTRACPTCPR